MQDAKISDIDRSPICAIPVKPLRAIQNGTMRYSWRGVMCNKNPFDLALYPMLIWDIKPKTIVEIGSKHGGSALWLHDICLRFGFKTRIVSIDIDQRARVKRAGIEFLQGDGRNLGNVLNPERMATIEHPLVVIEDADHHYLTTLAVLRFFDPYLQAGEYVLVEDGICNSFGNEGRYDGGPNRAIKEFLTEQKGRYRIDTHYCDFFGHNVTWCTNGFLRKE